MGVKPTGNTWYDETISVNKHAFGDKHFLRGPFLISVNKDFEIYLALSESGVNNYLISLRDLKEIVQKAFKDKNTKMTIREIREKIVRKAKKRAIC